LGGFSFFFYRKENAAAWFGIIQNKLYKTDGNFKTGPCETEAAYMANTKLEIQTETMSREIKAHGVAVLRYRIAFPIFADYGAVSEFYRKIAENLRDYAEKTAQMRAEKLASASRTERVGFREILIRSVPEVIWIDDLYVSVLFDFIAADKERVRRMVRLAHTFELASGRICMPSEFIGKRKKAPSENFYLTEDGPVFIENLFGNDMPETKRFQLRDYIKEIKS